LYKHFLGDLAEARLSFGSAPTESPVTAEEISVLPPPVQRYMRFMGVVDRPRVWSFVARFSGRFRRKPDEPWMPAVAWQYNTNTPVTRIYTMRLLVHGFVPMIGHDTYIGGKGRMVGKLFRLITVANGSGEEFDVGELTTYLNDAVLLAPSLLMSPATRWEADDDLSFRIVLQDAGRVVIARVSVDERGAPIDFSSTDRWADLPTGLVRSRWSTPVTGWELVDGRAIPRGASATWHFDDGPFTYVEGRFEPDSLRWNVLPETRAVDRR
jgi:hypothetical protein